MLHDLMDVLKFSGWTDNSAFLLIEFGKKYKKDGDWVRSCQDKCDEFDTHMQQVFRPNEYGENYLKIIYRIIKDQINAKTAPGHAPIRAKMIKELPEKSIKFIAYIFNAMMLLWYFSRERKIIIWNIIRKVLNYLKILQNIQFLFMKIKSAGENVKTHEYKLLEDSSMEMLFLNHMSVH